MGDLLQEYGAAISNMGEEEKERLIKKYLKQKEAARKRAKEQNEAKKKAGVKTVTIEVPGRYVKLFNHLVAASKQSRTEFFIGMLESHKPATNQNENQGALFRETRK